ncbi:MAG: hypothetical protein HGA45_31470, partial [Chloroflexales bacterium]|nr:hypothetical protein [Chloroflexales bacterium]
MFERDSLDVRCRKTIDELSRCAGWRLGPDQVEAYVAQILCQVPAAVLENQLEQVVGHFHADHQLVAALRDARSPAHAEAWAWVEREIARVTQVKGLAWSRDRAVEAGDLVQTVHAEVVRVIGDYHYASSLRTWLQSVTVRRLRRYHRDSSAAKRAVRPEPLEQAVEQPL